MNQFEMIVMIVLIVTIGRVLSNRYGTAKLSRREEKRAALAAMVQPAGGVDAVEAARMQNEIKRLNDRLAVLERIATDPAKRLSDEIESLKHN